MVPTCYGRQAILHEFGGLRMCMTSASIDSNRAVDCKVITDFLTDSFKIPVFWMPVYSGQVRLHYFFEYCVNH